MMIVPAAIMMKVVERRLIMMKVVERRLYFSENASFFARSLLIEFEIERRKSYEFQSLYIVAAATNIIIAILLLYKRKSRLARVGRRGK
mmetsp:Transcript_3706/g.6308  ORF Transcript_3706/g.6308 Transcript_3706/m.6308 type:complete len:89 (+) Transcript_3706:1466-1732(+)